MKFHLVSLLKKFGPFPILSQEGVELGHSIWKQIIKGGTSSDSGHHATSAILQGIQRLMRLFYYEKCEKNKNLLSFAHWYVRYLKIEF